MKKLIKYPAALISPVLAYFAYTGNSGASNLLVGWTAFGVILSSVAVALIGFTFIIAALLPDEEKVIKALEEIRQTSKKIRGFTFNTCADILCIVFFVWCGWWGLASMEFYQLFIIKFTAYITSQETTDQ